MITEKFFTKNNFRQFDPTRTKIVNFGQNWSSRAGKLAGGLFSYDGKSEKKMVPRRSVDPLHTILLFFTDIYSQIGM